MHFSYNQNNYWYKFSAKISNVIQRILTTIRHSNHMTNSGMGMDNDKQNIKIFRFCFGTPGMELKGSRTHKILEAL